MTCEYCVAEAIQVTLPVIGILLGGIGVYALGLLIGYIEGKRAGREEAQKEAKA